MESFKKLTRNEALSPDGILYIVRQIESKEISIPVKIKLLACLIPQQFIPEEAFIRMTCVLCDLELDLNLKIEILKWMITVYSFVDNLTNFECLSEIFFQFLENEELRPYVCQLLIKMTRVGLVTTERFCQLADLLEKFKSDPYILPLMFTYCRILSGGTFEPKEDLKVDLDVRGIYPSLIKTVHPSFDTFIPVYHIVNNDDNEPLPPYYIRVEKGKQPAILPTNEKSVATQSNYQRMAMQNLVTLKQTVWVENEFLAVYKEFESMKKQKVCNVLQNKYRRLFLSSDFSLSKKTSIKDFILVSMYHNSKNIDSHLLELFFEVQKPVPGICGCVEKIIDQWDGSSGLNVILGMLSYEPLCCFEKFQYLLDLICDKLFNSSISVKCDLLNGLSNLYEEWVLRDQDSLESCHRCSCFARISGDSSTSSEDHLVINQIHKLGNYIVSIFDAFLLDDNFPICLLNEILLHNEKVSRSHLIVDNLVLHPPSTLTFHAALFARNSIALESLCRLMFRYKEELKHMKENKHPEYQLGDIYLKRYSNDILSLLLRGEYKSEIITHLSRENVISSLTAVHPKFEKYFEVFRHPALIEKTASFIENSQMDISFVDIKNNTQIRDSFLGYLEENGQEFLVKFLNWLLSKKIK